ncbi:MAG: FliI/YscN family ATPase [Hyphomonadaceae bacterium]
MNNADIKHRRQLFTVWGTVISVAPGQISIAGISHFATLGNEVTIEKPNQTIRGEILSVAKDEAIALLFTAGDAIRIGDQVQIEQTISVNVGDHWLGQVVNYRGEAAEPAKSAVTGTSSMRSLKAMAPPPHLRRSIGSRLSTGMMATDTLLPICKGQRIGLFAGSGVGKSTLLGHLANGLKADRVVIALIGERSREVHTFANETLPPEARARAVIVASTASDPPSVKKRAAYCAMAAAEHFRDQGHNVLLIIDSITRFAEAHRETALLAGETPALNAFPPSTTRVVAELAERAGTGTQGTGDITAVFSVLVAGSDMEEPVADMVRGILDGHIILEREIAERGRYPAIDILKSVSRSLPGAASESENALLKQYRLMVSRYEEVAPMLRANLYEFGRDHETDRAINLFPQLDAYAGLINQGSCEDAYELLGTLLADSQDPVPADVTSES